MARNNPIRVEGYRELARAFSLAGKQEKKQFRDSLREAAEPVRTDAERLAHSGIPRVGLEWSRMRVGVTATSVYVAPRNRGTKVVGRKRPNFAGLLLQRAMQPALDQNRAQVIENVDDMLGDVANLWGRGG